MMDNKENSIYKMDQKRKISISKIDKILKVSEKLNETGHRKAFKSKHFFQNDNNRPVKHHANYPVNFCSPIRDCPPLDLPTLRMHCRMKRQWS